MEIIKTFDHEIIARLNNDVQDIHVSLYPEYFNEYDYESISGFYKQIMTNPNFDFLVIKSDEQYLGYAWIEVREIQESVFMRANKFVFVHQFSISKEYRNKGFGSQLMNKIEEIARDKGINRIQLDYWSDNELAREFYKKNEYKIYREFIYKDLV